MKFICSKGHPVKLKDKTCSQCGEELGFFAFIRRKWRSLLDRPLIACPKCELAFPLRYTSCPFCEKPNTVEGLMKTTRERAITKIEKASPTTRRKFQKVYLIVSALALAATFRQITSFDDSEWIKIGAVSIVYLGTLALLLKWFVRKEILLKFLALTNWVVKLSLILNYLLLLMVLQLAVADAWAQFLALAALVVITYGGASLFCWLFWPMAGNIKNIFLGDDPTGTFNSMHQQGREVKWRRDGGER